MLEKFFQFFGNLLDLRIRVFNVIYWDRSTFTIIVLFIYLFYNYFVIKMLKEFFFDSLRSLEIY